jgi:hypothetical protein
MDEQPKDTARPGLAGITAEHRKGWETGALSYSSIGRELGVTKQTVAAYARRNGWRQQPPAPVPAEPPPPQPAVQPPTRPASLFQPADAEAAEHDRIVLIEANRALLGRALQYLKGALDMMGLQRAQGILRGVREEWMALGHFGPLFEQAEEKPTELVIRRLSDEEEAEIQRQVEEDAAGFNGDFDSLRRRLDEGDDADAPPPFIRSTGSAIRSGSGAGSSQEGSSAHMGGAGNSYGGSAGLTGSPSQAEADRRWLTRFTLPSDPPLPAREEFRDWLRALADRYGRVTLRDLLRALGATDPVICEARDKEYLIAQILRCTGGDPTKLMPFVVEGSA